MATLRLKRIRGSATRLPHVKQEKLAMHHLMIRAHLAAQGAVFTLDDTGYPSGEGHMRAGTPGCAG